MRSILFIVRSQNNKDDDAVYVPKATLIMLKTCCWTYLGWKRWNSDEEHGQDYNEDGTLAKGDSGNGNNLLIGGMKAIIKPHPLTAV